jgi:hypothetical protein
MIVHLPDCPRQNGAAPATEVEWRVNMTQDRDAWQQPRYLVVCCPAEGKRLTEDKPRRWIEMRRVEPWERVK